MKVNNSKIKVFNIYESIQSQECFRIECSCVLTTLSSFDNEAVRGSSIEEVINKAIEKYWIKEFELMPTHYDYENNTQTYKMICKCDM